VAWRRNLPPFVLGALFALLALGELAGWVLAFVLPASYYLVGGALIAALAFAAMLPNGHRAAASAAVCFALLAALAYRFPYDGRKDFAWTARALEVGSSRTVVRTHFAPFPEGHPYGLHEFFGDRENTDFWQSGVGADNCRATFDDEGRLVEVDLHLDN
jgi:hypothetical protein